MLRELDIIKDCQPYAERWYQRKSYTINYDVLSEMFENLYSLPVSMGGRNIDVAEMQHHKQINSHPNLYKKNPIKQQISEPAVAPQNICTKKEPKPQPQKSNLNNSNVSPINSPDISTKNSEETLTSLKVIGEDKSSAPSVDVMKPSQLTEVSETVSTQEPVKKETVINDSWESQIHEIRGLGIKVNQTIVDKVKQVVAANVRGAIKLMKERNLKLVSNRAGYFISLLKFVNVQNEEVKLSAYNPHLEFLTWFDLISQFGTYKKWETRDSGVYWTLDYVTKDYIKHQVDDKDYWLCDNSNEWKPYRLWRDKANPTGFVKGYSIQELINKLR